MLTDRLVYISGPITPKHGRTVEQNVAAALGSAASDKLRHVR